MECHLWLSTKSITLKCSTSLLWCLFARLPHSIAGYSLVGMFWDTVFTPFEFEGPLCQLVPLSHSALAFACSRDFTYPKPVCWAQKGGNPPLPVPRQMHMTWMLTCLLTVIRFGERPLDSWPLARPGSVIQNTKGTDIDMKSRSTLAHILIKRKRKWADLSLLPLSVSHCTEHSNNHLKNNWRFSELALVKSIQHWRSFLSNSQYCVTAKVSLRLVYHARQQRHQQTTRNRNPLVQKCEGNRLSCVWVLTLATLSMWFL